MIDVLDNYLELFIWLDVLVVEFFFVDLFECCGCDLDLVIDGSGVGLIDMLVI